MIRQTKLLTLIAGMVMSTSALADLPQALDRVPADAMAVVGIPNVAKLQESLRVLQDGLGLPPDAINLPIDIFAMKGLNTDGSAAVAIIPGPDFNPRAGGEPPMVAVIPVTDYNAFVTGLGGAPGGVTEVTIDGNPAFLKSLDGGFAAMSPDKTVLEGFAGAAGSLGAFKQSLGASGRAVAESAEVFFIANLPKVAPLMQEGVEQFKQQAEMMAAMGQDMTPVIGIIEAVSQAIARDGQSGVFGLDVGPAGVTLGGAAQFKEGSPSAAMFDSKGKAGALLGALPDMPFLFASAMDSSGQGMKKIAAAYAEVQKAMGGGALGFMQAMEKSEGTSVLIGSSPALMGAGVLINSVMFQRTSDPAGHVAALGKAMTAMNGQQAEGMTLTTTFKPTENPVAGVKVHEYTLRPKMDPGAPMAQQAQAMMMVLFGPTGGLSGYIAPTEGGVLTTFAKNSALVEKCLKAAKGEGSLATSAQVKPISAALPADRTMEAYLGVQELLNMGLQAVGMFLGPIEFDVPEKVSPIGLGATTHGGGVGLGVFLAMDTMNTFKSLAEAVRKSQEGDAGEFAPPPAPGNPRF